MYVEDQGSSKVSVLWSVKQSEAGACSCRRDDDRSVCLFCCYVFTCASVYSTVTGVMRLADAAV